MRFRKFLVWKKLRDKKVGVTFYRRIFFVSLRRKSSWANLSVFEEVSSMEKNMDKEGGVTSFRREMFVRNRRKTTWANHSVFRNCSGLNFFCVLGVIRFCQSFLSDSIEKFRRGTFVFQKCSGIEKFLDKRYHDFVELFCLTVPNFCGEPFNVS